MSRFLSEIQGKYTELVQIAFKTEIFNRLVFPKKFMKFNRFSHPMTYTYTVTTVTGCRAMWTGFQFS